MSHRCSVVLTKRPKESTRVTGAAGQIAATAVSKTVTLARFVRKHGRTLRRTAKRWFWAPLQYAGLAETDDAAAARYGNKLRWRRLREKLLKLHRDNGVIEFDNQRTDGGPGHHAGGAELRAGGNPHVAGAQQTPPPCTGKDLATNSDAGSCAARGTVTKLVSNLCNQNVHAVRTTHKTKSTTLPTETLSPTLLATSEAPGFT